VRHHQSERLWLASLHHTKMAGELAMHRVAVSSSPELVLRHSPSDTFHVGLVGELATEFLKMDE
jgi:hypothetical protein